jgi:hypothetical protein
VKTCQTRCLMPGLCLIHWLQGYILSNHSFSGWQKNAVLYTLLVFYKARYCCCENFLLSVRSARCRRRRVRRAGCLASALDKDKQEKLRLHRASIPSRLTAKLSPLLGASVKLRTSSWAAWGSFRYPQKACRCT